MQPSGYIIHCVHQSDEWVRAYMRRIGWSDPELTFEALRASLTVVRDRLPPQCALQLGHRLPVLLRGIFFEGWQLVPDERDLSDENSFSRSILQHLSIGTSANEPDPERLIDALLDILSERMNCLEFDFKSIQ